MAGTPYTRMLSTFGVWMPLSAFVVLVVSIDVLLLTMQVSSQNVVSGNCRSCTSEQNTDNIVYSNLGDINIGGYVMAASTLTKDYYSSALPLATSEAIAFAVKLINEDVRFLPNVTLGFVLLDDGYHPNKAVAKTFQFIPIEMLQPESDDSCRCCLVSQAGVNTTKCISKHSYDIIGAISPIYSYTTIAVSYLFSAAKIPLISCSSTSDELSDNNRHPYFLRVIASSLFNVKAMLSFIHSNGWSYISVLHVSITLGEAAYNAIKELAPSYNICIATNHKLYPQTDFGYVVQDLLKYSNARVVIIFMNQILMINLFEAIRKHNARGKFIWLHADSFGLSFTSEFHDYENDILGLFAFSYPAVVIPELKQHFGNLSINSSKNPWFKSSWEAIFQCSFNAGTYDNDSNILDASQLGFIDFTSVYVDAVMVFAHAATKLLTDRCPGLTGIEARACIRSEDLLGYMKNVSFTGYSGEISFDGNGDLVGGSSVWQIGMEYNNSSLSNSSSAYHLVLNNIAVYNIKTNTIIYTGHKILWDHLSTVKHENHLQINSTDNFVSPESVCNKPCLPGELIIKNKSPCCWECVKCRRNEILVNESRNCQDCEPFTWPDPETGFTICHDITVTFPLLSDPVPVIVLSLAAVESVCTGIVFAGFVHFRDSMVIKASSRELSFLQLVALGVGWVTVVLLQLPPSDGICSTVYFTFSQSFTWLYSPILVKSLRIYRIFLGSSKHSRNHRCISCYSQIVMATFMSSIQIIICLVIYIIYKPAAHKSQPVAMEKYVELACDMTLPGVVSFLTYNVVLVFACSVLAFKTRNLPDNFNESWFIFICVATTLIIWLGFVPTYFTASRASVKTLMLSLALILNHTLALVFLFIPKIYAAAHAPAEIKPTAQFHFSSQPTTSKSNQVVPT